jgi:hypothetical protein
VTGVQTCALPIFVNKFYSIEGKINAILDILKGLEMDQSKFSEKSRQLYDDLFAPAQK